MTHWRSAEENFSPSWIDGSATLTIDRSRMTMNCETQQTASTSCLRVARPGSATGVLSVVPTVVVIVAALPGATVSSVVGALGRLDRPFPRGDEVTGAA